jgi:hypothetical protein
MPPKLDEGQMALVREAAREAAHEVLDNHPLVQDVRRLRDEVWAKGQGLHDGMLVLRERVEKLEASRSWLWQLVTPVLSGLIVAGAFWLLSVYAAHQR